MILEKTLKLKIWLGSRLTNPSKRHCRHNIQAFFNNMLSFIVWLFLFPALTCASERGYVFDECGSPCKRTCANRNLPPEEVDRQCFLPCVSRCQCFAGKVEHEGRCITPSLCPDRISAVDFSTTFLPN